MPIQLALACGPSSAGDGGGWRGAHAVRGGRTEGMDRVYVSRMANLTTLAPDIVAVILDETLPPEVTLFDLASGTPLLWEEQRKLLETGR